MRTLIISEKPSVAISISKVLGATKKKDGYYEGNGYIVSWCIGHLIQMANPEKYDEKYAKWNIKDLPIIPKEYKYETAKSTKKQFNILKKLMNNKSMFVVPNHIVEQFGREFNELYPAANILCATEKDFTLDKRKRFCSRIATGDYDAVIIGHSQFERIPISKERQEYELQSQIDEIVDFISEYKRDRNQKFTVKQLEKTKKGLEAKLKKLNDDYKKDDVVTLKN